MTHIFATWRGKKKKAPVKRFLTCYFVDQEGAVMRAEMRLQKKKRGVFSAEWCDHIPFSYDHRLYFQREKFRASFA